MDVPLIQRTHECALGVRMQQQQQQQPPSPSLHPLNTNAHIRMHANIYEPLNLMNRFESWKPLQNHFNQQYVMEITTYIGYTYRPYRDFQMPRIYFYSKSIKSRITGAVHCCTDKVFR